MISQFAGLRITALSKTLTSGGNRFDLTVPELSIEPGEIVGLIGRSGSGKSTLLDLIALVSMPDHVERMSLGNEAEKIDLKKLVKTGSDYEISQMRANHLGYILQHGGLLNYLTVRRNIELPFRLSNRKIKRNLINQLADRVGIENQLDKYPSALSGGQRQRVSVLRAIATQPSIILCDEPTASVDEHTGRKILDELTDIARHSGSAILLVSHDMELVSSFTDRTYLAQTSEAESNISSMILEVKP